MAEDNYEHVSAVYATKTKFNPDNIPEALKELDRWVIWSLVKTSKQKENDKPTKRPIRLSNSNPLGPTIDIAKWSTPDRQYSFEHCLELYNSNPNIIGGLGFIPNPNDGIIAIDYDNYFPVKPNDPRTALIDHLTDNTFVELSQSGNGLHAFLFGELHNRLNDSAGSGVELYPGKKQSFIAMTGVTYDDSPSVVNTDQDIIDKHIALFFSSKKQSSTSTSAGSDEYSGYEVPEHIPNGNRNNELTKLCGWLFSQIHDVKEVAARMFAYNQELCETPLSTEELQAIINSIGSRHNAKFKHLIDNIYHIRATNTWYDFADHTELNANSLDISHIKEFPGKKGGRPLISKWLASHPNFNQAADFTWVPVCYGTDKHTVQLDGRVLLNTWRGFSIEPKQGDVQPWLNHLAHVVPEEDYRRALLWWIAFTIQHPDVKINWQPVILGVSGAGKDALFRPIATILGSAYKTIGNRDIKGDFDDGLYQTKLLHISEAKGLSGNAIEFYKRITAKEASTTQLLNIKGKAQIMQQNLCNVIVVTNNLDAMKFSKDERRPLVLRSPKVMTEQQQTEYFDKWLEHSGSNSLFQYLLNYDLSEYKPGIRPYKTTHFDALFDITQSDQEIGLNDVIEQYDVALPLFLKTMIGSDDRYSIAHIKVWLENNGWKRWDEHVPGRRIKRKIDGEFCSPKSRQWYVRIGSKFDGSSPVDMCFEVERIEALMIKQYKFQ